MKKFFTVFKFEFFNLIKSKPFIVITLLVVIGLGVALSYPRISDMMSENQDEDTPVDTEMTIAVINESVYSDEQILALLQSSMADYKSSLVDGSQDDAVDMIKDGEYGYVLYLSGENEYTIVTESIGLESSITYRIDGMLLYNYRAYLLKQKGFTSDEASSVLLSSMQSSLVETGKSQSESFLYTYILLFFLYMIVIVYGQMVATSVATEKSSRAMEVLVTTIDPVRMMFGKVLGIGAGALCQVGVVVGAGALFFNLNKNYVGGIDIVGSVFDIPPETLILSIILIVIGFFVYAFI